MTPSITCRQRRPCSISSTLDTPYAADGAPLLQIVLTYGDQAVALLALVDSGATRSMFPLQVAQRLGVTLEQDALGARGVEGAGFPTWSALETVMGQVVRIDPDNQQASLWGDPFRMTPAFCEKDPFLLGRQDFFAAFPVKFVPGKPDPSFILG
jgi:hypothetical protein